MIRYWRSSVCVVLGALALTGCSKPAATGGASAGASETPAASVSDGKSDVLSALQSGPGLKAGLWQMTTTVKGMTSGLVTKMCLDEGLTHKFASMGTSNPGKMACSPTAATRAGSVIDVTTVCKSDGLNITNKMHMEMAGDDAYHQTVTQSYDPPMAEATVSTIEGKFLGGCGDLKPGDMTMPGGVKINMYDVEAKAKG